MNTLEVKNLKKTFKLSKKQQKIERTDTKLKVAVNDLSFTAYPGEIFGLLGPNGAGKTTCLRAISTLIKPDFGDIFVGETSVVTDPESVRGKIGFLTSELKLEDHFTPNYLYIYFSRLHGIEDEVIEERKDAFFERFGIAEFREVKVGDLSTGMKQKVSIAISLVHNPDYIIIPGGGYSITGLWIELGKIYNCRIASIDSGFGIILISTDGIAANLDDIPRAIGLLKKKSDRYVFNQARKELEKRRLGKDKFSSQK